MRIINSLQVNPRCYKCEVTSYYLIIIVRHLHTCSVSILIMKEVAPEATLKALSFLYWLHICIILMYIRYQKSAFVLSLFQKLTSIGFHAKDPADFLEKNFEEHKKSPGCI